MNKKRIAFITGATAGIGEATARILSKNNFKLVLCGRRKDRLEKLSKELSRDTDVITLQFDVTINKEVVKAISSLPSAWKDIDVLLNNAGGAHGMDPIQSGSIEDWDAMIDSNVKGLLYVSREILPGMIERKSGHVINLGSIAGREIYVNGNVYCASKFAVDALTRSMRVDLNPYGIKVTAINPGLVETEFAKVRFKGDAERASNVYKGITPLVADDIADAILFTLTRPGHVVIADMVLFPVAQASVTVVNRGLS
jgi:3-hydroxy acid dehydrogenase/malonic semialdehyde reductase